MTRQHAKVAAKRGRRKHEALEAYRCRHCSHWHVGHAKKHEPKETWEPRIDLDRPTPERKQRGHWVFVAAMKGGSKAAKDMTSHPIDRMEYTGQITNDQASAARDYEQLYRSAVQIGGIRDSTTLWEPKGHESDDGNVEAVTRYRQFCRAVGMIRERQLQWVCIERNEPRPTEHDIGQFREALNEAARFFGYGKARA